MKELSAARPKHLIPLDNKPVLEHVVTRLRDAGIGEQIIVIGHLGEMIQDHFGDGSQFDVQVSYAVQKQPTGTGSAVHSAESLAKDGPFLMTFGDIVTPKETYSMIIHEFQSNPCDAMILLNWVDDPYRGAAVYIDETGRINKIIEKPPIGSSSTNWNQSGIFIYSPILFEYTAKLRLSDRGEYELTSAVQSMITDGLNIRGCITKGPWCDVGTPDDIATAKRIVSE